MLNEAREEDAEGMLRPKPKEKPMPERSGGMGDLGCRYLRGCRDRATADEVAAEPCAKRERNPGADQ